MFCQSCGRELAESLKFCDGCGEEIAGPKAAPVAPIGKQIREEVRARSHDAWSGLKVFALSPVGGLAESYVLFDERRAIVAGVSYALLSLGGMLVGAMLFKAQIPLIGGSFSFGDLPAKMLLKLVTSLMIPFLSLSAALGITRLIFRGTGRFAGDVYTAGASLLPVAIVYLAVGLLGIANLEVILILAVFALTYVVLMLYSGCSRIAGIPEAAAAPAVPIILLVSGWLTKIVVVAMWKP